MEVTEGTGRARQIELAGAGTDLDLGGGGRSLDRRRRRLFNVGPQSAGADPGPVCYGRGGTRDRPSPMPTWCGFLNPEMPGRRPKCSTSRPRAQQLSSKIRRVREAESWRPQPESRSIVDIAHGRRGGVVAASGSRSHVLTLLAIRTGRRRDAAAVSPGARNGRIRMPPACGRVYRRLGLLCTDVVHGLSAPPSAAGRTEVTPRSRPRDFSAKLEHQGTRGAAGRRHAPGRRHASRASAICVTPARVMIAHRRSGTVGTLLTEESRASVRTTLRRESCPHPRTAPRSAG